MTPFKQNKYHNRPVVIDGKRFASRREGDRYSVLKLLERAGKISDLETQVRYSLDVNGMHVCYFVADFRYFDTEKRQVVVEDSKGFRTDVYRLKAKLMRAVYGIEILET